MFWIYLIGIPISFLCSVWVFRCLEEEGDNPIPFLEALRGYWPISILFAFIWPLLVLGVVVLVCWTCVGSFRAKAPSH